MSALDDVQVVSEPLTYERWAPRSYFRDRVLAFGGDVAAETRLRRHADEMRVELPKREARIEARAAAAGLEVRVNPNRTDGQGGYFSSPVWLLDQFAGAPRTGRVLSALIPNLELPAGASEVKLPRMTTGTHTAPASDGQAVASRDIVDAALSQPVTAIAGISDVALQLLEQTAAGPHFDFAVFSDLHASYDAQLEFLLINGVGVGNTFAGILNLTTGAGGVNAVTYTDGSPTAAAMAVAWAKAFAQVGDARFLPPEVYLMRSARWAWYGAADTNISSSPRSFLGAPAHLDDAIPATLGGAGPTNGTQDAVIAMRPSDSILLESATHTDVKLEPLSGLMQARLTLHGYATAIHRQPTGIATVTGTGQVVQSGY